MEFNAYLMTDWSASNKKSWGKNSIWWCLIDRNGKEIVRNPRSRAEAVGDIVEQIVQVVARGDRILAGFDFPYGYPHGFADSLRAPAELAGWRKVWSRLSADVRDDDLNRNNRFDVAARLNEEITGQRGPFWGTPVPGANLSTRRIDTTFETKDGTKLPRYRLSERALHAKRRWPHEVWKLFTAGSVGSQSLVGIPRVQQVRAHETLADVSLVWPFETGLRPPPTRAQVVHAEIWPGVIDVGRPGDGVIDREQVIALARWFRGHDEGGSLTRLFCGSTELTREERRVCIREEGWILGVS